MDDVNFERSIEIEAAQASLIPTLVGTWWKEISKQSQTVASPGKLYAIGNYLVQLVKNSLGGGGSDGKVTVVFDGEKIKITIDDLGTEEKDINLNVAGEYGMKESVEYFDVFTIESKGRKYEKNNRNMIEETDESDVYAGSKVTIVKYHVTPVEEAEDEFHSSRKFRERM
jgi:hypothetical protein